MHPRWVVAVAVCAGAGIGAKPAHASQAPGWREIHEIADDVHVEVDEAGGASVQHLVRWHVVHGPIASVDLAGVDASAVLEPAVAITADDGRLVSNGHAARQDATTVRVAVDDPKALARGTFVFDVRWRVDLGKIGGVTREGGAWRVTLRSPIAADGFDGARTFLDLPAAPDPPRAIDPETGAVDPAALATLQRGPLRDSLELLHPHVARGQSVVWTVRADPRAFRLPGDGAAGTPGASAGVAAEPDRVRSILAVLAWLGVGALFALLVLAKTRAVTAMAALHGGRARPLVPLPSPAVAALGGAAMAAAVGLEMAGETAAVGGLIAAAVLAATVRATPGAPRPRAAGRWLALRPADAFAPARSRRRHAFDIDGTRGRAGALAAAAALALVALVLREAASALDAPWLVAIDGAALVPLFVTGRSSQLGADRGARAARWLARIFAKLRRVDRLRVVPWARVAIDGTVDELRLLVPPPVAVPGLVGLELGLGWSETLVGCAKVPGVLVRVLEGSAAAARVARFAPHARAVLGRRREERVYRFTAPSPAEGDAVALVRALASLVTDRRSAREGSAASAPRPYSGRERRRDPLPARPLAETPRALEQAC
jgi:hypothetical protein